MNYYLTMAWRNIWRNKRRSLITISSILFAIFFSIVMRGFQLGSYKNMVDNVVQAYTGYIQVFDRQYQSDKIIENTILMEDNIVKNRGSGKCDDGPTPAGIICPGEFRQPNQRRAGARD